MSNNEVTASDVVRLNTEDYGRFIIASKFPNVVDGLKRVHIRILWAAREYVGEFKSSELMGEAQKTHNHGDSSIYDTIVRMSQKFCLNPTLFEFDSSDGNYGGSNAASQRYTELHLSEFTKDVFFKGIVQEAIPKQMAPNLSTLEPIAFIPAIPTALIYANYTIGFAFSSNTVPFNFRDICDLTCAFIKHMKTAPLKPFDYIPHIEKLIPDFPIKNTITNVDELIKAYKQGDFKAKIVVDGHVEISHDTINIHTLPFGEPFEPVITKLREAQTDQKSKLYNPSIDRSVLSIKELTSDKLSGNIAVTLKRNVDVFEVWDIIRKIIGFTGSISPIPNYTTWDWHIREVTPINILREWYDKRYNILLASKKYTLTRLTHDIRIKEAQLIVCDHTDEVITIIRNNDEEDVIKKLCERFPLTVFQATHLSRVPIIRLSKTSRIDLERQYTELKVVRDKLRASFDNIPDEIIAEIQIIKKKYSPNRTTNIPEYIGYVDFGTGCIQFETIESIPDILKRFPKSIFKIFMYNGPYKIRIDSAGKFSDTNTRITSGKLMGFKQNPDNLFTVYLNEGSGCVVRGFVPDKQNQGFLYTAKKSKALFRDGSIKTVDITEELSYRKNICTGGSTKMIHCWSDISTDPTYIAIFSSAVPNIVTIYRIMPETTKISINPTGNLYISQKSSVVNWFINVPVEMLSRQNINVLHIVTPEMVLENKTLVRLDLAQAKTKNNKAIEIF